MDLCRVRSSPGNRSSLKTWSPNSWKEKLRSECLLKVKETRSAAVNSRRQLFEGEVDARTYNFHQLIQSEIMRLRRVDPEFEKELLEANDVEFMIQLEESLREQQYESAANPEDELLTDFEAYEQAELKSIISRYEESQQPSHENASHFHQGSTEDYSCDPEWEQMLFDEN
eukprot:TRINITY_DN8211_c0_g1_i4.p1 TRINITY_DN8211_c0_g1~~TRINITY_DN8211_c0_g1_i4.p1  ORF type:complete len:171 (+),score=34.63 TRINITY_DN8211_c0_g1_i4:50-562(+)